MSPINKLPYSYDVGPIINEIRHSCGWGKYGQRKQGDTGPHREMVDIWARYNDPAPFISGDRPWSEFNEPHDAKWLFDLPEVVRVSLDLLEKLDGSKLGGVLITKLPPGGRIYPHTDSGWHAEYYDKYWVPIANDNGAVFKFGEIEVSAEPGSCWAFRNDVEHEVINNSESDKISLIICVKQSKLTPEGFLCRGGM